MGDTMADLEHHKCCKAVSKEYQKLIGKRKLEISFSEESSDELEDLRIETGLPNRADVVKCSLRLFNWILVRNRKKAKFFIEENGSLREIIVPFWEVIKCPECGCKVVLTKKSE